MLHNLKYFVSLIFLLILGVGCTNQTETELPEHIKKLENLTVYAADAEPAHQITLTPDVTYRDTGDVLFGPLIYDVVADVQGRAYLLDLTEKKIHVFDGEGQYQQSIGREGRGPGEFLRIADIQVGPEYLHVLDPRQTKISVFNRKTFEHQKDLNVTLDENQAKPPWLERTRDNGTFYRPNDFYPLSDGDYLVVFSDPAVGTADNLPGRTYEFSRFDRQTETYSRHDILSFDWTGGVLVHDHDDGLFVMFEMPYKRQSEFDVEGGKLLYGWTEDFLFKVYDETGDYQHAFYYPFEKPQVTEKAALAHFNNPSDAIKAGVRNDTLPETFPAFKSVLQDDRQRLWVSSITENPEEYLWRVLNIEGHLLAQFQWPANRSIKDIRGEYVYTAERNMETGAQEIARYKVELQ